MKSRPSKKIIILSVCAFVVIVLLGVNKYYREALVSDVVIPEQNYKEAEVEVKTNDLVALDTDNDGLADWREIIIGTDINKKDTDNDGTSDSKEVELQRDPLVSGPNDSNPNQALATSTSSEPETISEGITRNLFANTVYLSNSDQLTPGNTDALVNNLIGGIQSSFTYKEYQAENLKITTDESSATYEAYASTFATNQLSMMLSMQKHVREIENNIQVLADIYAQEAINLALMNVPKTLADVHLEVVNSYSQIAAVLLTIYDEKKDPLKLPLAINTYQRVSNDLPRLIYAIGDFLRARGIIFTNNEIGGYWNIGATTE